MSNTHAIILCGGSGSRLWPRSRSKHPKHLLELNGGATLVQETVRRIKLPANKVLCVTEQSHSDLLAQQLPDIPQQNIVVEPGRRGTASAIGLALWRLKAFAKPETVVISLHADHLITDQVAYRTALTAWVAAAEALPKIVTLGIQPTYPSTAFGYINLGKRLREVDGYDLFTITTFVEKPNQPTAESYVASGRYLWNAGMFAAQLGVFEAEIRAHMPELAATLDEMIAAEAAGHHRKAKQLYLSLPNQTIDYGVLEKSSNLAVVPANFGWADVGSWADLHDVLEHDADGNVFEGEYIDIDSQDCFVYSPRHLVATIGLSNLVIINTGDAVLICPKDRAQDVKKVVEELTARNKKKFL